jgi:hypothetical protein
MRRAHASFIFVLLRLSDRGVSGFGRDTITCHKRILYTSPIYSTANDDTASVSAGIASENKNRFSSKQQQEALLTCQGCSKTFPSRNSLFRHIRTDPSCSLLDDDNSVNDGVEYGKQSLAIQL